jgi:hypothetical protein
MLIFYEDGTFDGIVDCDMISGTYDKMETELSLAVDFLTRPNCAGLNSSHDAFMGFWSIAQGIS